MNPTIAVISLVLGSLIALSNWYSIYASRRTGRFVSAVPVLGATLLVIGLLGFPETRAYAWVGIIADYGTIILIVAAPRMIWEAWATCSRNVVHRFVSDSNGRRDDIRLFERGWFTIRSEHNPPVPCNDHGAMIASSGFVGTWRKQSGGFVLDGYAENRVLQITKFDGHYETREQGYPEDRAFPVDRFDSLELIKLK